jgi:hypothetical protein
MSALHHAAVNSSVLLSQLVSEYYCGWLRHLNL